LAPIACFAGIGLLVCSIADALSRATLAPSSLIFWAGMLLIVLPAFFRLSSAEPSARERLAVVCLLGLALYAVKLLRDPFSYTLADEFVHQYNADRIIHYHALFRANPILPIAAQYPGLEGATSALSDLTRMSSFGAGLLLIGAARLALVAGLFLLFSSISGSPRVGGLGAAIYTANANFLLFDAQFSYESLALPLLVVVLAAVAERRGRQRSQYQAWSVPITLGTAAIVITHHLTSYALVVVLVALAALHFAPRRQIRAPSPWPFALLAAALTLGWLFVVASLTVGYLSPVLGKAWTATLHVISGETAPRHLFHGGTASVVTPIGEKIVALASVVLLALGLPFGLRQVWQRYRAQPFALLFCVAAIGFFATLALRLAPAAWETSTRASEFMFIGLAFVLACMRVDGLSTRRAPWLGRALVTAGFGIVFVGGVISGQGGTALLSQPLRVAAGGRVIESEPVALSRWTAGHLAGGRFVAGDADARLLMTQGRVTPLTGTYPAYDAILTTPTLESWQLPLLRHARVRYVAADRRRRSQDQIVGYFFSVRPPGGARDALFRTADTLKFGLAPAARIFDSGNIVVYDLQDP
jgi:hypothetical protein